MPSLSLNVGLNNGRKLPFGGGAAPSGIPVASTSQILVVSTNIFIVSAPFNKLNPINFGSSLDENTNLEYTGEGWTFYNDGTIAAFATSSSDYIPTSGYTIVTGGGSITITAA